MTDKKKQIDSKELKARPLQSGVRKTLLRLLIGWWMVPSVWVIVFPLMMLMSETNKEAIDDCIVLSKAYWNGFS